MSLGRRSFLQTSAALLGGAWAGCRSREAPPPRRVEPSPEPDVPTTATLPTLFIGHGAPTLALDAHKGADFRRWGEALGRPRALLVVSAHWERAPVSIGTVDKRALMYDFGGFPRPLYEVQYDAPGAPDLADRVAALIGPELRRDPERPLDHGVWVPLVHLYPAADVPVLQLSLPSRWPAERLYQLGRALAPLRREGVLIVGSGNVTHNLRALAPEGSPPAGWAVEHDQWVAEVLSAGDVDALLAYRERAPALRQNHPTEEHLLPLLVAAGAWAGEGGARFPITGWEHGNLSRRSAQLG